MRHVPLIAAFLAAVGCGGDGPPTVRYGQEECVRCRMIVNDDRFAAAAVTASGEARKFDEIGCLIDYLADHPEAVRSLWVRGYRSGTWLNARTAYFAHGPKLQTPMGAGLAAAATKEEADSLAAEWGGKLLRFDELADFLKKQSGSE